MIDTCTPMFTAALFTIAKLYNHPSCPKTDEWIMKTWYIYIMEHFLSKRKDKIRLFTGK
jgi:hypothetical protein